MASLLLPVAYCEVTIPHLYLIVLRPQDGRAWGPGWLRGACVGRGVRGLLGMKRQSGSEELFPVLSGSDSGPSPWLGSQDPPSSCSQGGAESGQRAWLLVSGCGLEVGHLASPGPMCLTGKRA